jgi:hypothetical protein
MCTGVPLVKRGEHRVDARAGHEDAAVARGPGEHGLGAVEGVSADEVHRAVQVAARRVEDDVLLGFNLGADDHITKPYSPRQLVARVRTILRRVRRSNSAGETVLRVADLVVDPIRHEVTPRDRHGLGLAITRHLAEAHGGSALATSTPGEGSTFSILLPSPDGRHEAVAGGQRSPR